MLFFTVAAAVYILNNSVGSFPFLYTLINTCYFFVFLWIANLTGVRWYLIVGLISISLVMSDVEHLLICLLAIRMPFLEKFLLKFSYHFLTRLLVGLLYNIRFAWVLCTFWILISYQCMIYKYLLPFSRLLLCFVDDVLHYYVAYIKFIYVVFLQQKSKVVDNLWGKCTFFHLLFYFHLY